MNRLPPDDKPIGKLRPDDESGYQPPPAKPKVIPQCWSCCCDLRNGAEGLSLTGNGELQCCWKCWDSIPASQRLVIVQRCRQGNEVAETLNAARSLLELAIREYSHRPREDCGEGEN